MIQSLSYAEAIASGFAGFNNCTHLCVDVPEGVFTITVRTPYGKLVTFGLMNWASMECIDIKQHHDGRATPSGSPVQDVCVRGNGELLHQSSKKHDSATMVVLNLL